MNVFKFVGLLGAVVLSLFFSNTADAAIFARSRVVTRTVVRQPVVRQRVVVQQQVVAPVYAAPVVAVPAVVAPVYAAPVVQQQVHGCATLFVK